MNNKHRLQEIFARNLKERRKNFNLTQAQLASEISVSTSFITEIETGRKAPSFTTIEKLSCALKAPAWSFFCVYGDKIPEDISEKEQLAFTLKSAITEKIDEIINS